MWLSSALWNLWKYKAALSKAKSMKKDLEKLVIRSKEWTYIDENWTEQNWAIVIDITWELKIKSLVINDVNLLDPSKKSKLEEILVAALQKWLTKAQEVSAEKAKWLFDWVDMNSLWELIWWLWK